MTRRAPPFWLAPRFCLYFTLLPPANEVWGKVIFLRLFVILFTGGVCLSAFWDTTSRKHTPPRSTHTPGKHTPPWEAHPPGSTPPPEAHHPPEKHTPSFGAEHAGRYGQRAGGTHPTGMQFCFWLPLQLMRGVKKVTTVKENRSIVKVTKRNLLLIYLSVIELFSERRAR